MPIRSQEVIMRSLDLVTYANHSRRIPATLLMPAAPIKDFSTKRILLAHGADFWSAYFLASMMSMMSLQSIQFIMVSSGIKLHFLQSISFDFSFLMFPMIVFSYFFFSYLMNHGQTYGMYLMKKRIKMEELSFMKALKWASHSTLLCFSFGISFLLRKEIWKEMRTHDYLYHELLTHKDVTHINLLSRTRDAWASDSEEVNYQKAA